MTLRVDYGRGRPRFGRWMRISIWAGLLLTTLADARSPWSGIEHKEAVSIEHNLGLGRQEPLQPARNIEKEGSARNETDEREWRNILRKAASPILGDDPLNPLEELHYALETMQKYYFEIWVGTWPTSIDWTGAVMGTHVSASLFSLTRSLEYALPGTLSSSDIDGSAEAQRVENEINKYFSQVVAYYFGEDHFAIRHQQYDDILWVVLGWLETIKFVNLHNSKHYPQSKESVGGGSWYGTQFERAFAHRAHIFWDLSSRGWDTVLCGGGMLWGPHGSPYKNAITNQLFISASIGMYLYFPGDDNTSPYIQGRNNANTETIPKAKPFDTRYLHFAIAGYAWLRKSGMTNAQGLYTDGFHIHDYGRNGSIGTGQCDERNDMVYTYNQGVLLSGLRGLWEGTGQTEYLEDGHQLIRDVMAATGWDLDSSRPNGSPRWAGLGRNGVMEEICDSRGSCDQNGHTFKGIFFHHMTLFCEPLPTRPVVPGKTHAANPDIAMLHRQSCKEYAPWVAHNAKAALVTRDSEGRFGTWWGRPADRSEKQVPKAAPLPQGAVDYRNGETPNDEVWASEDGSKHHSGAHPPLELLKDIMGDIADTLVHSKDVNDRGRGRTVETQGGGIAVLRCMWELLKMYQQD